MRWIRNLSPLNKSLLASGVALTFIIIATPVFSSDYGCKVLLCLSNPGGPTEFSECVPPIQRLKRDLSKGKPMPSCEEANSEGYTLDQGYQPYLTCEQSYGPDYKPYHNPSDFKYENRCGGMDPDGHNRSYKDGFNYTSCTQCVIPKGNQPVLEFDQESGLYLWNDSALIDRKPAQRNNKPRYLQLMHQGAPASTRHYYR